MATYGEPCEWPGAVDSLICLPSFASAVGGNWTSGTTWTLGTAPTAADDAVLAFTSGKRHNIDSRRGRLPFSSGLY